MLILSLIFLTFEEIMLFLLFGLIFSVGGKVEYKLFININKKIKLDENRKIYTSIKYDTTIIEIEEEDNINKYIELDKIIFDDLSNLCNENIYIIQYPRLINTEQKAAVSYGILEEIQDKYNIVHKCSTETGSFLQY